MAEPDHSAAFQAKQQRLRDLEFQLHCIRSRLNAAEHPDQHQMISDDLDGMEIRLGQLQDRLNAQAESPLSEQAALDQDFAVLWAEFENRFSGLA